MDHADLPPNARRILDAARNADDPTPSDRARIDIGLATRLRALGIAAPVALAKVSPIAPSPTANSSAGADAAARASTAPAASSAVPLGKLALALVGAGVIAGALTQFVPGRDTARAPEPSSARPVASSLSAATDAPKNARPAAPELATPELAAPEPARAQPLQRARGAERSSSTARRRDETARVAGPRATPSIDSLREEVALLEVANEALQQKRYVAALSALDAHERQFAAGALREERMGLRVLALCGAGQYAVGRAARHGFLRDAPRSVLARKVLGACEPDAEAVEQGANRDQTD